METTLLIVSVVSLALAVGMSVLGWRLIGGERRRAAARVEALQALADAEPEDNEFPVEADPPEPSNDDDLMIRPDLDWMGSADQTSTQTADADQDSIRPTDVPAVGSTMFAATVERARPRRRSLAFAIAAILMAGSAGTVYAVLRPSPPQPPANPKQVEPMMAPANARPLELLSLRHTIDQSGAFTVTGLVQNPANGQVYRGVIAVVFLFDRDGNYVASGRTALEFNTLSPGDESPFVVRVPSTGAVSRYRVGFRYEGGGVVAHVDRRGQALEGTTAGG